MTAPQIRSGEVLHLSRAASVQFIRPITVRVIRVLTDWHTYDGWVWIDAYQLNAAGDAFRRRTLFLMPAGVRRPAPPPERVATRRAPPPPERVATRAVPAGPAGQGGATIPPREAVVPLGVRSGRGRACRSAGTR
ncbi:hypothetical protein O7612_00620 [Micromonospora sp. WMMD987]|uniref:hypothetical protein n=1 Tax=Micromonospora rifamycinica TaxID=291594 RepID=UPI00249C8D9A|nr:hypothetical protein [Micromonospora sp. WMMD987]WFE95485.1 hypothetical protein O7612_00620 [Micromonospora sp. WMMD987]